MHHGKLKKMLYHDVMRPVVQWFEKRKENADIARGNTKKNQNYWGGGGPYSIGYNIQDKQKYYRQCKIVYIYAPITFFSQRTFPTF